MREGITRILRFMSGMKQFRAEISTQKQLKEVYTQNRAVRRCAMIWKEKVFRKRLQNSVQKKKVTFQLPFRDVCGTEVCSPPSKISFPYPTGRGNATFLSSGQPTLSTISMVRSERLKPRTPDFLLHSLEKEGVLAAMFIDSKNLDLSSQIDPSAKDNSKNYSSNRALDSDDEIQLELKSTSSAHEAPETECVIIPPTDCPRAPPWLSGGRLSTAPQTCSLLQVPMAMPGLMPPSSFKPRVQTQSTAIPKLAEKPEIGKQPHLKPVSDYSGQLLSPTDFLLGKGITPHVTNTVKETTVQEEESNLFLKAEEIQIAALQQELADIYYNMQRCQEQKEELKAWRRHAHVLSRWLESGAPGEDSAEQEIAKEVQNELQQLEQQIEERVQKLNVEKTKVHNYIARIEEITASLDAFSLPRL
ncbi:unnamed protein product [Staurois parvus]|uniref:Uncharacterized protein n=1 Tax=Staurois parvus TaxID=386267 RepID=A0ABN9F0P5_9NEOB|nr:unnamed protein product [Staurois parvus]